MKEDIEQAVLEMIKKSGVELGVGELESIIDASFNTASEHISNALSCIPLKEGATHTSVLVWYAKTPEMPGTVQKRVALVAFSSSRRLRPALGQSRILALGMTTKSSSQTATRWKAGKCLSIAWT